MEVVHICLQWYAHRHRWYRLPCSLSEWFIHVSTHANLRLQAFIGLYAFLVGCHTDLISQGCPHLAQWCTGNWVYLQAAITWLGLDYFPLREVKPWAWKSFSILPASFRRTWLRAPELRLETGIAYLLGVLVFMSLPVDVVVGYDTTCISFYLLDYD